MHRLATTTSLLIIVTLLASLATPTAMPAGATSERAAPTPTAARIGEPAAIAPAITNDQIQQGDTTIPQLLPSIPLVGTPAAIAVNDQTNTVYVVHQVPNSNDVLMIINGATNEVTSVEIDLGFYALAVNSSTNRVYNTNIFGRSFVRNGSTGELIDSIVGAHPETIAINSTTNRIYIEDSSSIRVVDGNTNTVIGTVYAGYHIAAINPASGKLYIGYNDAGVSDLRAFDINPVTPVLVSDDILPKSALLKGTVNTKTNVLYFANQESGGVSIDVINGATDTLIGTIQYPEGPNPDGTYSRTHLYEVAINEERNELYVVATKETLPPVGQMGQIEYSTTFEIRDADTVSGSFPVKTSLSIPTQTPSGSLPFPRMAFNAKTGRVYLTFSSGSYLANPSIVVIQADEGTGIHTISGRIVDTVSGQGIAGVSVSSDYEDTATTDANGYYTMTVSPVVTQTYTITPFSASYSFTPASRTFDVPPGRTNQDFAATPRAANCAHFVADVNYPDGSTVSPGQVFEKRWRLKNCGTASWSGYQAVRTGGSYGPTSFPVSGAAGATVEVAATFTAPATPGTYRATYKLQGPTSQFGDAFWVEVVVQDGGVGSDTFSIRGRITDQNGLPVPNVTMNIGLRTVGGTDSRGYFVISNLRPGKYIIHPSQPCATSFTPKVHTVTITNGDVNAQDFVKNAGYRVSGRVTDVSSRGIGGVEIRLGSCITNTAPDGNYHFTDISAGSYDIAPWTGSPFWDVRGTGFINVTGDISGYDFTIGLIDIGIWLYRNPSMQERAQYEEIIRFFADGIFESSNGATKLRTVEFYTDASRRGSTDIEWISTCRPNSFTSGYRVRGGAFRLLMCDGTGGLSGLDYLRNPAAGGYTLAHEWGHYYAGLYDEYREQGRPCDYGELWYMPCEDDEPVPNSIMHNQNNAIGGKFDWLNYSTVLNDTRRTAQFRVFGASGWETLARPPSQDPRDENRVILVGRLQHPELMNAAPGQDQKPRIDLIQEHTARSMLQVFWNEMAIQQVAPTSDLQPQITILNTIPVQYPEPILILATIQRTLPLARVTTMATVTLPDSTSMTFMLRDDGQAPDKTVDDGFYSGLFLPRQNGVYTITAQFANPDSTAIETSKAYLFSPLPPGIELLPSAPISVTENFSVAATTSLVVTGVVADDHGNIPAEATALTVDTMGRSGVIESPGDLDVFRIDVPISGRIVVRVTNIALGAQPRLRLLASDGVTELANIDIPDTATKYVWNAVEAQADTTLYAVVSDKHLYQSGGIYDISAGKAVAGEGFRIALPLVVRQ